MAGIPDIQLSAIHLDSALAQMKDLKIPSTPANIRVWYDYAEGENSELTLAIDELKHNKIAFDADLGFELYHRFFGELPHEKLREFKRALRAITSELSHELSSIKGDASECINTLSSAEKALEDGCELEALRQITSQLIAESRKMVEQNGQMGQVVKSMQTKMSSLEVNLEKASNEALTDKLTGISNRRAFDKKMDDVLRKIKPESEVCLLMMDIDHFKKFNDSHGHIMGDKVLRFVAQMVKKIIKGDDFLARTGGEEFQLILENCSLENGLVLAEKIRTTIAKSHLTKGKERVPVGNVTLSIGVATVDSNETRNNLINRADKLLYRAKAQGRNLVIGETEPA